MKRIRHAARGAVWVGLLAVVLGPHAMAPARAADPLPEFYGFYAVDNGRLIEFKSTGNIDVNVSPSVRFIVFNRMGGLQAADAHLSRMKYLRYVSEPRESSQTKAPTRVVAEKKGWYRDDSPDRSIELRAKPVEGKPEMMMLVPREPLTPGAYTFVGGGIQGHFFVNKEALFTSIESSADCFDQIYPDFSLANYLSDFDQVVKSGKGKEIPCAESDLTSGAADRLEGERVPASPDSGSQAGSTSAPATKFPPAYETCVARGVPAKSCEMLYPPTSTGEPAGTSIAPIAGRWVGEIKWRLSKSKVVLDLNPAPAGQPAGRAQYTKILESSPYCEGALVLVEQQGNKYTFKEEITRTRGLECPGGGTVWITLDGAGSLNAAWENEYRPGEVSYQGAFRKS